MKIDGRRCDRCGKLYDFREMMEPDYVLTKKSMGNTTEIDICPECISSLTNWFNSTPVEA